MITKTAELIAIETGQKHTVTWEEEEGHTDKVLRSILDDLGEEEGESREAAYEYMLKVLDAEPTMIFEGLGELSVNTAIFLDGYEAALKRNSQ